MRNFIRHIDPLASLINEKANKLFGLLTALPVHELGLPPHCLNYFLKSHYHRLFFSVETSARLLYLALRDQPERRERKVVMDYGAGVGSLYLLAKMIGCYVIYNDLLEDWKISARLIAEACQVKIDEYIVGDIDATLDVLQTRQLSCDIITSRNVIEHIYKPEDFFNSIRARQPWAAIYSSTTANYYNPAAHLQHIRWHRKCERRYVAQRAAIILEKLPALPAAALKKLAKATRGLAGKELENAIENFEKGMLPVPKKFYTNTCDPSNGVWAEHLLTFEQYRLLIGEELFQIRFLPGFWDTHYSNPLKSAMGAVFNRIINKGGKRAFRLAPFIYVIAQPRA